MGESKELNNSEIIGNKFHEKEHDMEKNKQQLNVGSLFGELFLINQNSWKPAFVIALEKTSCITFNSILFGKIIKVSYIILLNMCIIRSFHLKTKTKT